MTLDTPGQGLALNIRNVAESSIDATPESCRNCQGKTGLAILPVCMYPAPKSLFEFHKDDAPFKEWLSRLGGLLHTSTWHGTWNYLRIVPAGYIYVLKQEGGGESMTWDTYAVGADGMLNRLPPSGLPATPDETLLSQCTRTGHSDFMPQFFCLDPETTPKAWIAFSRHRWTDAVRDKMRDDEDARGQRMREVDVEAAARGDVGYRKTIPFGQVVDAGTIRGIADYADAEFREKFQQHLAHSLLDRSGHCDQLVENMARASVRTENKKGVMLLLPDAVGLAEELNLLRSQALQQYHAWEGGGPAVDGSNEDVLRPWKRQSATHVAYIEAWVEARARSDGESLKTFWEESSLGPYTEAYFNRLHGAKVNGPPVEIGKRGVRNHLSGARWVPAMDPQTGQPMRQAGNGDPLGYVELSPEALEAFREFKAGQTFETQMDRYSKRLRVEDLKDFNKLYSEQEQAWIDHIISLDKDYAWYVRSDQIHSVLMHDFDDDKALTHESTSKQINVYLDDAQARLNATEKVFGGGVFSEASLEELSKQFNKEPGDRTNWIATALLRDFDFLEAVVEPDPDMYSGLVAATQWGVDAWSALKARGADIAATAQSLTLTMQQVANKLRAEQLNSAKDGKRARSQPTMNQIAQREVVWVRASALHEYLGSNKKHYSINVTWKSGEYLDALYASGVGAPVFTLEGRTDGDRRRVSGQRRNARGQLNRLSRNARLQGEIVVPLVVEKSAFDKAKNTPRSGGTVQVSNNAVLGHPSPPVAMPRSAAEALLQEKAVFRERSWANLANRELGFTGIMVLFSIWELSSAVDSLATTSGWEQAEAAASFMGGVSGILAGGLEVAAYSAQVASRRTAPVPTSLLLSRQASRALALRMGAGMLGAVGALTDTASSAAKAVAAHRSGEIASRNHYIASTGVLFTSASISGANVFLKWRVAVSARMGHQAAVSLMRGVVLRGSAAAFLGVGASTAVTGIGIVLFIAGLAWALYAAYLAHDENEKFLDRSFFGKHERKEDGRFGGPRPRGSEGLLEWMAGGLGQEILALGGLAMGVQASLEWRDAIFSRDTITIRFMLGGWDSEHHKLRFRLEGYEQMPDLKVEKAPAGDLLLEAHASPQQHEEEPSVYVFEEKLDVKSRYNAARLIWELIDVLDEGVVASGEVWEKD